MDIDRGLETAFWACLVAQSLQSRSTYWTVVLFAFSSGRILFTVLMAWSSFSAPWQSIGKAILASISLCGWIVFGFIWLYCLFLTPLHVFFSPLELLKKYSPKRQPIDQINVLYEPKEGTRVDVFAIHGLGSNPATAWMHRTESKDGSDGMVETRWLEEFLPKDEAFQYSRIMLLNHQTRWDVSASGKRFEQHADSLLHEVEFAREKDPARPVIFIAHSFGGLLLKQTILQAVRQNSQIAESTRGIIFLGVPHGGTAAAFVGLLLSCTSYWRGSSSSLFEYMAIDSSPRKQLMEDFHKEFANKPMLGYGLPYICDVYEDRVDKTFGIVLGKTVTREHGTIGHGDELILDTDHRGLNKFSSLGDPNYILLHRKLRKAYAATLVPRKTVINEIHTLPFLRDPDFVGRETIIKELDAKFSAPDSLSRVALVGLGGMGKSQIAIEYSHRVRERSPGMWVFWVHASNVSRFEQDYRRIAEALKIPGREDSDVDILKLVTAWLRNESNGSWFLVIDNADDKTMFHTSDTQDANDSDGNIRPSLLSYIPQTTNGQILVTSRTLEAAQSLVGDWRQTISIGSMEVEDAVTLIEKKLPPKLLGPDLHPLVDALSCIPLAITQAAAYISMESPIMTIPKYLQLFLANDTNQARLLDKKGLGDLRRDADVPNAVIATWRISFNQIQVQNSEAADLLSLMSVLDRQGIPEFLLLQYNDDQISLNTALSTLQSYSLIKVHSEGHTYDLHRLVQLATKFWLKDNGEKDKWIKEALILMEKTFPDGKYENREICLLLVAHVEAVVTYDVRDKDDIIAKASILYNLASYIWSKGDYRLAKTRISQALEIQNRYLTEDNLIRLRSAGLYATVLSDNGEYIMAEQMRRQQLALYKTALGLEHPHTLQSMHSLASALQSQGKHNEAEQMYRQTLESREKVLDLEHPDTLASMNNLASVLLSQGKYNEAEQMCRQTLESREKVLGLEHPDTLASMHNLALILQSQGKYNEAEQMCRQTLGSEEKVLGLEHPDTLISVWALADLFHGQGHYNDAFEIYERACSGFLKVLGPDHPKTLACSQMYSSLLEEMEDSSSWYTTDGDSETDGQICSKEDGQSEGEEQHEGEEQREGVVPNDEDIQNEGHATDSSKEI